MTFSCVKMADKVVVQATSSGKSLSTKVKTTFSEERLHKDYFKTDIRQNAINRILLLMEKQGSPRQARNLMSTLAKNITLAGFSLS